MVLSCCVLTLFAFFYRALIFVGSLVPQAAYLSGRREYTCELEAVFNSTPFESFPLRRGKKKQAGTLKGVFRVVESRAEAPAVDLSALRTPKTYHVRVYVMTGENLVSSGHSGAMNPYIVVRLGGTKVSLRDKYQRSTNNPAFYCGCELTTKLPGLSELAVEVWDHKSRCSASVRACL
jgi:hypothetical protein